MRACPRDEKQRLRQARLPEGLCRGAGMGDTWGQEKRLEGAGTPGDADRLGFLGTERGVGWTC